MSSESIKPPDSNIPIAKGQHNPENNNFDDMRITNITRQIFTDQKLEIDTSYLMAMVQMKHILTKLLPPIDQENAPLSTAKLTLFTINQEIPISTDFSVKAQIVIQRDQNITVEVDKNKRIFSFPKGFTLKSISFPDLNETKNKLSWGKKIAFSAAIAIIETALKNGIELPFTIEPKADGLTIQLASSSDLINERVNNVLPKIIDYDEFEKALPKTTDWKLAGG